MLKPIPLNKLHLSERNVRKDTQNLNIEGLAADMAVHGLLQNLVVETRSRPKGHFDVTAGGRRLRALQHNAEKGVIPKDHPVNCEVRAKKQESATEVSLSENYQRLKMSPADEIAAFDQLVKVDGLTAEQIAERYGIDKRNVEGRLRLAGLHADILQALREKTITLEHAKAYASTANQDRQKEVFDSVGNASPSQIYRILVRESVLSNHAIALFIGEKAYTDAGGRIELQLFTDEGDSWIDPEIVEKIAGAKIEAEATDQQSKQGLAWVKPILGTQIPWDDRCELHEVRIPLAPLSEAQASKLEKLEAAADALWEKYDDEEDETASEALRIETQEMQRKVDEFPRKPVVLPPETLAQIGQFLLLDDTGASTLDDSYYAETNLRVGEDGKIITPAKTSGKTGSTKSSSSDEGASNEDGPVKLSKRLSAELMVQRRDVLGANLAVNPELAMNYMLFTVAISRAASHRGTGSTLSASSPSDPVHNYPKGEANVQLAGIYDALDVSWTSHDCITAQFDAFCELPDTAKLGWAAYVMAQSLQSDGSHGTSLDYTLQGHLAGIMKVDFAQFWRPTAENYWDGIKKASILNIFEDVGSADLRSRNAAAKKGDLARSAEKLFTGDAIVEPETKEAALQWLPPEMDFALVNAKRQARAVKAEEASAPQDDDAEGNAEAEAANDENEQPETEAA